jgi:archaemetzincin
MTLGANPESDPGEIPPTPSSSAGAEENRFPEGFWPLPAPRKGEWRSRYPEPPQPFEEYRSSGPNRPSSERAFFYLQPLGNSRVRYSSILECAREYADAFFGVPARVLPALPLPEEAYIPARRQFNSAMMLERLARRAPPEALVYLAIVEEDLFGRGLKFVFGESHLQERAGVCSFHRLETSDPELFLRRTLRLVTHEAGHILSLRHCAYYRCVMQGSSSLPESDAQPLHLCPIDLRKLAWNTGIPPTEHYLRLREFYRRHGLRAEAEWVSRRLSSEGVSGREMAVLGPGRGA